MGYITHRCHCGQRHNFPPLKVVLLSVAVWALGGQRKQEGPINISPGLLASSQGFL